MLMHLFLRIHSRKGRKFNHQIQFLLRELVFLHLQKDLIRNNGNIFHLEELSLKEASIEVKQVNRKISMRAGSQTVPALQGDSHGKTVGYVYSEATPSGFFSLSDACRSGVQEAIGKLKLLGIKTAMLTGDSQAAAMQAQEQLGHSLELVHAELTRGQSKNHH